MTGTLLSSAVFLLHAGSPNAGPAPLFVLLGLAAFVLVLAAVVSHLQQ